MSTEDKRTEEDSLRNEAVIVAKSIRQNMLLLLGASLLLVVSISVPDARLVIGEEKVALPVLGNVTTLSVLTVFGPVVVLALLLYLHIFIGRFEELRNRGIEPPEIFFFTIKSIPAQVSADFCFYFYAPLLVLWFFARTAFRPEAPMLFAMTAAALLGCSLVYMLRARAGGRPVRKWVATSYLGVAVALVLTASSSFAVWGQFGLIWMVDKIAPLDLRKADLSGMNLSGFSFDRRSLAGANLTEANLEHASFAHSDLSDAVLREALLTHANLRGAGLERATLEGADLSHANLTAAMLHGVKASGADFSDALLERSVLASADLKNANFTNARAVRADFSWANLEGARYARSILDAAVFQEVQANGAIFMFVQAAGASFSQATLQNARFQQSSLVCASFLKADVSGSNFEGADLNDASFDRAIKDGAIGLGGHTLSPPRNSSGACGR